jgi:hypothetical protein
MVDKIKKLTECIDDIKPYQSKGDAAVYYLKLKEGLKSVKYDADCVKSKLNIAHRIGDSFFYITSGGGAQFKEQWILIETKGKGDDYFEQLEKSLSLFEDAGCRIYGRYIGKNVPAILSSKERKEFDKLQHQFLKRKGNLYLKNKIATELWHEIGKSEFL